MRRQSGRVEVTHYVDGSFEHHRAGSGAEARANNLVHVMDDRKRIAVARVEPRTTDDRLPAIRFHLSDHVGSTGVVADSEGALVTREEFTPFGLPTIVIHGTIDRRAKFKDLGLVDYAGASGVVQCGSWPRSGRSGGRWRRGVCQHGRRSGVRPNRTVGANGRHRGTRAGGRPMALRNAEGNRRC